MMNAKLSQHCNKDKFSKLYKMIKLLPDGYNLFPSNKGNIWSQKWENFSRICGQILYC